MADKQSTAERMMPQMYANPLRLTSRGFTSFVLIIVLAYVALTVMDKTIPAALRELVALVIGYGGARTFKQ